MTTEPSAKVIADSISSDGDRVTTMEVVMHRFVLAEFNTHRVFSRNSASSRAIPALKQIRRVTDDPAAPVSWPSEQRGMQGGEELAPGSFDRYEAEATWARARGDAADRAQVLVNLGVHKSVVNRLLEPFMWHTVVVTSTAWENFFGLRRSPLAQPEIRAAAEAMHRAYRESEPRPLLTGAWHLPYLRDDEWDLIPEVGRKVSAARCARVSYLTQDGVRDIEKDIELYDRLTSANPMHASPLEHVATPAPWNKHEMPINSVSGKQFIGGPSPRIDTPCVDLTLPLYGNLLGWHQLRFDVEAARGYRAFA